MLVMRGRAGVKGKKASVFVEWMEVFESGEALYWASRKYLWIQLFLESKTRYEQV